MIDSAERCTHCSKLLKNSEGYESFEVNDMGSERRGGKAEGFNSAAWNNGVAVETGGRRFSIEFNLCYKCLDSNKYHFEL